jgi:hypothetical protein
MLGAAVSMRGKLTFWRAMIALATVAFAGVWLIKLDGQTQYQGTRAWRGYALLLVSCLGLGMLFFTEVARIVRCLKSNKREQ